MRGSTAVSTSARYSRGTPGTKNSTAFPSRRTNIGALPAGFSTTSDPAGTITCFMLFSVTVSPRTAKRSLSAASAPSCSTSGTPAA